MKNRDFSLTCSRIVLGVYLQMLAINEPTQWLAQIAGSKQKLWSISKSVSSMWESARSWDGLVSSWSRVEWDGSKGPSGSEKRDL